MDAYAQIASTYAAARGSATLGLKMLVAIAREEAEVYGPDDALRDFLDSLFEQAVEDELVPQVLHPSESWGDDRLAYLDDPASACQGGET